MNETEVTSLFIFRVSIITHFIHKYKKWKVQGIFRLEAVKHSLYFVSSCIAASNMSGGTL